MSQDVPYRKQASKLERLMSHELGLSRGDLAKRSKRARRLLPRSVRRDLTVVAEAADLSGNPRIARTLDQNRIGAAYERARLHLEGPEPARVRKARKVGVINGMLLNLLLIFCAVICVMIWVEII